MISHRLINGLLLLAKLYPNGKASATDYGVEFTIIPKDNLSINNENKQLLEDWGWTLNDELDGWEW